MLAKYPGMCDKCSKPITVGQEISWNRKRRGIVYHLDCSGNGITTTQFQQMPGNQLATLADQNTPSVDFGAMTVAQIRALRDNNWEMIEDESQDCPQCRSNTGVRIVTDLERPSLKGLDPTHRCVDCNNYFNVKSGEVWEKAEIGYKSVSEKMQTIEVKAVQPVNGDLASVIASAIQSHLRMPPASVDAASVRVIVKEELQNVGVQPVRVEVFNSTTEVIQDMGVQHHLFPELLQILSIGLNVWLTGPAGSGKTTAAHNCAKALNLEFRFCGAQSNEYGLLGFVDANGKTVRTPFREAYEHGGVFLFDEVDASAASAVLAFNAALANGVCNFPDAIVERHEKFVCIAAANTFGLGATNDYVGRMKQDAAFIDRFVSLAWDIDEALETSLSGNVAWSKRVQHLRKRAGEKGLKVVISPRASIYGAKLLASGMKQDRVEALTVRKGMTSAQWESIS